MILGHLTDPREKDLVKAELSRRYYEHYLRLGQEASQVQTGRARENSVAEGDQEHDHPALEGGEDQAAGPEIDRTADEALAALDAVPPLALPRPAPPAAESPRPQPGPPAGDRKKRCFIATAAYGSPGAPQVILLQQFREQALRGRPWGERGLRLYYRFSPAVAALLDHHPPLRPLARGILSPLIWWLGRKFPRVIRLENSSDKNSPQHDHFLDKRFFV
ncbi:MAG: CFI-box-CTERM domain-containing protein [Desulfobacca sp.]|uniref:CFI-box-CTERM domain-containing protein n=1 Tax=Desulfobacca sp. TaxID=2067990 RepID=UPI00404A4509